MKCEKCGSNIESEDGVIYICSKCGFKTTFDKWRIHTLRKLKKKK